LERFKPRDTPTTRKPADDPVRTQSSGAAEGRWEPNGGELVFFAEDGEMFVD